MRSRRSAFRCLRTRLRRRARRGPDGRPGSLGTAATFSFFPSKNLGCLGDGGAIATSREEIAEFARMLRFHGSRDQQTWELVGYNSRLDEIQAAFLRVQLPELDGWARGRCTAAAHYERAGLGELVALPIPTPGASAAWHLYVIRSEHVATISQALSAAEIGNRDYYAPADPPPPGDGAVHRGSRAADDRRPRLDAPGDPDEPVPRRRSGGRGHALRRAGADAARGLSSDSAVAGRPRSGARA